MKSVYEKLFEGNKLWVEEMNQKDPYFFEKLSKEQRPPVLWIGCSDSRVPANEITKTLPGEIFVTRNIANVVVHTDMSMLSVLDYAVNKLGVTDVIVCGHYGCGGIMAERLVELNVIEQVLNLTKTSIIQNAWAKGDRLEVHGVVYDLKTGLLNDLNATVSDKSELPKFYQVEPELV